jgi:hypothetical protein
MIVFICLFVVLMSLDVQSNYSNLIQLSVVPYMEKFELWKENRNFHYKLQQFHVCVEIMISHVYTFDHELMKFFFFEF